MRVNRSASLMASYELASEQWKATQNITRVIASCLRSMSVKAIR